MGAAVPTTAARPVRPGTGNLDLGIYDRRANILSQLLAVRVLWERPRILWNNGAKGRREMWAELRQRRVLAGQLLLPIWVLWQLVIVLQFDVDLPCEPDRHHKTTDDKVCACAYASATVWHWPTTLQSWKLLQPVGYVALRILQRNPGSSVLTPMAGYCGSTIDYCNAQSMYPMVPFPKPTTPAPTVLKIAPAAQACGTSLPLCPVGSCCSQWGKLSTTRSVVLA